MAGGDGEPEAKEEHIGYVCRQWFGTKRVNLSCEREQIFAGSQRRDDGVCP